jgi:rod shape determining protein RodA
MNGSNLLEFFKKYDFSFFGISTAIFLLGILNLYSATHSSASPALADIYTKQLIYFFLSIFIGMGVSLIQPKNFFRYAYAFFWFTCILLGLVLILGDKGMGAQRWIIFGPIRLQPSEITKVAVVLVLGRWYSKVRPDKDLGLRDLIIPFIIVMIPTALIIAEPDLGTGLLVLLIFFVVSFYRRLKWKTLGILALLGLLSGGLMYQFGLKKYQKKRIVTFLNPGSDARGSGYNAIQSKIAIGSGQFRGKGLFKSSQASLNYLPENHTDFVFSIFNEEHGFLGSIILISLYLILFVRYIWLASSVPRMFDSIVVIGLMSLFFWHTVINMGMVMGMLPIVGLPLPFMSFGGSAMVTFGVCNGIATSLSNARNLF